MQGVEPWRRPEGAFKTYRDAVGNYEPSGRKKKAGAVVLYHCH